MSINSSKKYNYNTNAIHPRLAIKFTVLKHVVPRIKYQWLQVIKRGKITVIILFELKWKFKLFEKIQPQYKYNTSMCIHQTYYIESSSSNKYK